MTGKMMKCKACEKEIAASAKVCPHCGAKNRKPIFTRWWFWALAAVIVISVIAGNGNNSSQSEMNGQQNDPAGTEKNNIVDSDVKYNAFSGDCGISATAEMGTDMIGQPTVTVSVSNTTDKDISAIKFYAVPLDVYGDELKGIFTQNELYTDDTISAGSSDTCTWQFLDNKVKKIKLYVYSVFFSDGTEWGDKAATTSVILKNALQIEVDGQSGN